MVTPFPADRERERDKVKVLQKQHIHFHLLVAIFNLNAETVQRFVIFTQGIDSIAFGLHVDDRV